MGGINGLCILILSTPAECARLGAVAMAIIGQCMDIIDLCDENPASI
jgi:hypothetical protein